MADDTREQDLCLIVGLGNPGSRYAETRHNVGFMVVDALAAHGGIRVGRCKFDSEFGKGNLAGRQVVLAKPRTFMNLSGQAVQKLARFFKIPSQAILVIHDDVDLSCNRIKIKEKGGDGGHKGIRSIIAALGTDRFIRIRVGVGRPETEGDVARYVLQPLNKGERNQLEQMVLKARDAVMTVLSEGTKTGMNRFNRKT